MVKVDFSLFRRPDPRNIGRHAFMAWRRDPGICERCGYRQADPATGRSYPWHTEA